MPPETPTAMVRPRSMTDLDDRLVVAVGHFAADTALERRHRGLADHVLGRLSGPLVEAPRFAGRDDRELVLADAGRGNKGSKFRHRCDLLAVRVEGNVQDFSFNRHTRARSASTMPV